AADGGRLAADHADRRHGVPHQRLWRLSGRQCTWRHLLSDDGRRRMDLSAPCRARARQRMTRALAGTTLKVTLLVLFAFAIIGPLANLVLWSFAERWYFPFKLPVTWGVRYWGVVFRPTGVAMASLATSISIALLTVTVALAVSIPAGYALARLRLPFRALIMIVFLLPQAFPGVAIYINVARIFYGLGLAGTIAGVVIVHAAHALVYSVWITSAAFASVDRDLELAARNLGARAP